MCHGRRVRILLTRLPTPSQVVVAIAAPAGTISEDVYIVDSFTFFLAFAICWSRALEIDHFSITIAEEDRGG